VVAASGPNLDIRLLGPVEVFHDGGPLDIGGKRQRRLLTLLAVEPGRVVPAERLIEELWAGSPPRGAATTLKVHVSRLRGALGSAARIRGSTDGYAFDADADTVDVVRFERGIDEARGLLAGSPRRASAAAREALRMWRGEPFGEVGGEGVLATHATRLHELRLEALELRIGADLRIGRAAELVGELEALVAEHPYRERLWHHLMLALYRSDRQADALAAYHRARSALAEELGVEPAPELVELEAAILRQEVPGAVPPDHAGHNLPAEITSFIGRREELATIARLLGEARLVTLTGVGGVGKTRLGLEAARAALDRFADGAWFVDLARLSAPDLVPAEVASALDVPEDAASTPTDRLVAHLKDREALLVLDNCEHLVEACAALVQRLLASCPAVRVLATSRVALGVAGERVDPVPPLSLSVPASADGNPRGDAVALFLDRARAARPGIALDTAAAELVERICADLDGLPLAIELAAARARSLALPDIAARLSDRFRFLVSWRRVATARHRTLREAMDWSYELLGGDERALLERLAVFAGGFDLEAAAAVSGAGDEADVLDRLERLMDASLVSPRHAEDGPSRYDVLETVRQYAADRLQAGGSEADVRGMHAAHYLAMSAAAATPIRDGPDGERWLARLSTDRDNIRAALSWLRAAGHAADLLRMAEGLWWYWWMRGEAAEGRGWLEAAVGGPDDPPDADPALIAAGLSGLAGLSWSQGDFDAARAYALRADAILEEIHDDLRRGGAWNTIGVIEHARRDLPAARLAFERSIELMRSGAAPSEAERGRRMAKPVDNLGYVLLDSDDLDGAVRLFEEARRLHLEVGGGEEGALFDLHQAWAEILRGRHDEAAPLLVRALRYYRSVGFLQYTTECLDEIGLVAIAWGRHDEAAVILAAASRLRERTSTPFWGRAREEFERGTAIARAALGDAAYEVAFDTGWNAPEASIDRALELVTTGSRA
jgi:predicted ATPase/DNA-binding SARP family transcriptional activator